MITLNEFDYWDEENQTFYVYRDTDKINDIPTQETICDSGVYWNCFLSGCLHVKSAYPEIKKVKPYYVLRYKKI